MQEEKAFVLEYGAGEECHAPSKEIARRHRSTDDVSISPANADKEQMQNSSLDVKIDRV